MRVNLLIAGVSTRAAAESAARAGFAVCAIDAFADLDQHPLVRPRSLGPDFTPGAAARAAQDLSCDAVVYLSNFENHPNAIRTLAAGRALWGNPPDVVSRVRDPLMLAEALKKRGMAVPEVRLKRDTIDRLKPDTADRLKLNPMDAVGRQWLVKPLSSGGGQRIRAWQPDTDLPRGCYLQEFIEGPSGSVVFVAAAGRAVPLGISRQLVGEKALGAEGYQYCGSILETVRPEGSSDLLFQEALVERACALAHGVADAFGLVGLGGIDFVARHGVPYPVELNPRWCASMELLERAYGTSILGTHAAACTSSLLPDFDLLEAQNPRGAVGKAVVYARRDVNVGDTRPWLSDDEIRDIPRPGVHVPAHRPVCTVFADGRDASAVYAGLLRRAERVYERLTAWE
jgi:predicted ATP-grasp superfamily ATP-dependent carboligase